MARLFPNLPEQAIVIAGDLARESLELPRDFEHVRWDFFGKLVKLARGLPSTHAHITALELDFLAALSGNIGKLATCLRQGPYWNCFYRNWTTRLQRGDGNGQGRLPEICPT